MGLVHDTAHQVHANSWGVSHLVMNSMKVGDNADDEGPHSVGNVGVVSMEHVEDNRPPIHLLASEVRRGRELEVTSGETLSISQGKSASSFSNLGLLD